MEELLRVGACSMAAIPGDIDTNLENIKNWTLKGADESVEILLFPELSLSGYWTRSELHYEAQKLSGPAINELINFLQDIDSNIRISVGLAESHAGCLYNTQVILDGNQGVIGFYRKTHWPSAEVETWGCGNHYPLNRIKGINVGTAICYDNNFPEVHRTYGLKGADLVLSPYAYGHKFDYDDQKSVELAISKWKDKEKMFLCAAAAANYLWIAAVVGAGHVKDYMADDAPDEGFQSWFPGVILFIAPDGKVVKESSDDQIKEQILYYDISKFTNLEHRKGGNNYFKNRRVSTYKEILELP